jgi:uncharacterized protein YbjT (DUF2867 family)
VIGATGTVGSEVARQLAIAGDRPRVLVRDAGQARRRLGEVADVVLGDLDRPESLEAALIGVDRVFLLSGKPCDNPTRSEPSSLPPPQSCPLRGQAVGLPRR